MDLVWYGKKWINMRIKRDCESFLENIENIITLDWMWLGEFSLGKKCVCDIKERGREQESKLYFHYCNGKLLMDFSWFFVGVWFYFTYEKKKIVHISVT